MGRNELSSGFSDGFFRHAVTLHESRENGLFVVIISHSTHSNHVVQWRCHVCLFIRLSPVFFPNAVWGSASIAFGRLWETVG